MMCQILLSVVFVFSFTVNSFSQNDVYWNPNYQDSIRPVKEGFTISTGYMFNNFTDLNKSLKENNVSELSQHAQYIDLCIEVAATHHRIFYQIGTTWQRTKSINKPIHVMYNGISMYNHAGLRIYESRKFFAYVLTGIDMQINLISMKYPVYESKSTTINFANGNSFELRYLLNKHQLLGISTHATIPLFKSEWQHYYQLYGEYPSIGSFVLSTGLSWTYYF